VLLGLVTAMKGSARDMQLVAQEQAYAGSIRQEAPGLQLHTMKKLLGDPAPPSRSPATHTPLAPSALARRNRTLKASWSRTWSAAPHEEGSGPGA